VGVISFLGRRAKMDKALLVGFGGFLGTILRYTGERYLTTPLFAPKDAGKLS
jgi:fluoride ion exporter CrcB/FEX